MNPLIQKLPTKIKVGDEIISINADYRNCLEIILAYEDEELTIQEKHYILLKRLYKTLPKDIETGILQGIKFLDCGEERKETLKQLRVYSFKKDAKYIYSAVSKSSNVDLENINFFHWWKFFYYFLDISNNSTFSNIVTLRQKKNKRKLTDEEKKVWLESMDILDLEYNKPKEESTFMKAFNSGGE